MSTFRRRGPGPVPFLTGALLVFAWAGGAVAQTVGVVSPDPAVLDQPGPRALDGAGNLYVAGVGSDNLFRVAPDGTVTLLANPVLGLPAPFVEPRALAIDSADNVYVACALSDNLFRFAPDGTASVVVDANGDGLGNFLNEPTSVVAVGQDVWVAGLRSDNVFHVSPSGVVTQVLDTTGTGGATLVEAEVRSEAGRVFVVGKNVVFEIGSGGAVTQLIDATGDGTTAFNGSINLCVDTAGTVFVVAGFSLFRIAPGGTPTAVVPFLFSGSNGPAEIASDAMGRTWLVHASPQGGQRLAEIPASGPPVTVIEDGTTYVGLTADDAGNLYWVRPQTVGSDWVLRRAPDGTLTVLVGQLGAGGGEFLRNGEEPLVAPDGSVFVVGRQSDNVLHAGNGFVDLLLTAPDTAVPSPTAVAVDRDGRVIAGGLFDVIRFDPEAGSAEQLLDATGDGLGNGMTDVEAIATAPSGDVWTAAWISNNVFRVSPTGFVTEVLDVLGTGTSLGNPQELGQPTDLVVDAQGNVFVSGFGKANVFRITPTGDTSIVLDATGDGVSPLSSPRRLAVDGAGNLYVSASAPGSGSVFRVTPGGVVTRIADFGGGAVAASWEGDVYVTVGTGVVRIDPSGTETTILTAAGDGQGNVLDVANAVAVDAFGSVFVSGRESDNVFRVDPDGTVTEVLDATGAGLYAPLDRPIDLALDLSGNVYVVGESSGNVLSVSRDDWWTDLGGSSVGSNGRPTMSCRGDLTPGSSMDRVLTNVPPNALMLVWIAFQSTPFDALGGTVHAFPFARQVLFVADASGQSSLSIPWPAGVPPGIDVYLQFIVQDPSVPDGLTLSNACVQTTP